MQTTQTMAERMASLGLRVRVMGASPQTRTRGWDAMIRRGRRFMWVPGHVRVPGRVGTPSDEEILDRVAYEAMLGEVSFELFCMATDSRPSSSYAYAQWQDCCNLARELRRVVGNEVDYQALLYETQLD
mgnify:CR=1 FL=1